MTDCLAVGQNGGDARNGQTKGKTMKEKRKRMVVDFGSPAEVEKIRKAARAQGYRSVSKWLEAKLLIAYNAHKAGIRSKAATA